MQVRLGLALAAVGVAGAMSARAAVLPAERLVDWSRSGVAGGIPERALGRDCRAADGAVGDGVADDTAAIAACLASTPEGSVAYLAAGTYLLSGPLVVPPMTSLRGAGPGQTVLRSMWGGAFMTGILRMASEPALGAGTWPCPATQIDVVGSPAKGDTTLTLATVAGLAVGDVVVVSRLNGGDGDFDDGATIDSSVCGYCGICGGTRLMSMLTEITAVDAGAKRITVEPPLVHGFDSAFAPSVALLGPMRGGSGIEDLTVENVAGTDGINIELSFVKDSWVRNVESLNAHARNVIVRGGLRNTVQGCSVWTDAFTRTSGGIPDHNYGVSLETATSFCRIEDNRFDNVLVGPDFNGGPGAGNVVAYNYVNRQYYCGSAGANCAPGSYDSQFLQASIASHASHTTYNLFEGNQIRKLMSDNIHGSSAYGVLFRNRIVGEYEWVANEHDLDKTWGLWLVMVQAGSTHYAAVGNVLGYPGMGAAGYQYESSDGVGSCGNRAVYNLGWGNVFNCSAPDPVAIATFVRHGNYDFVSGAVGWDPANADHALPASLYLAAKPAWWCDETPWPPIGPDLASQAADIPAKRRYDGLPCTRGGVPGPDGDEARPDDDGGVPTAGDGDRPMDPAPASVTGSGCACAATPAAAWLGVGLVAGVERARRRRRGDERPGPSEA